MAGNEPKTGQRWSLGGFDHKNLCAEYFTAPCVRNANYSFSDNKMTGFIRGWSGGVRQSPAYGQHGHRPKGDHMNTNTMFALILAGATAMTALSAPALARRGADDPVGHVRHGRGADDAAGDDRRGRGADDAAGDDHGGHGADDPLPHD
jgi:hypothetical protein